MRPSLHRSSYCRTQAARAHQCLRAIQDRPDLYRKINGPFLFELKGMPAEYKAGLNYAIAKGWLVLHESGTFVRNDRGRRRAVCVTLRSASRLITNACAAE
jgi:hypothetical protein